LCNNIVATRGDPFSFFHSQIIIAPRETRAPLFPAQKLKMHFASTLLQTALHWLSPQGHAVVQRLIAKEGHTGSAHEMAVAVGLKNRFQLSRLLEREGLPCLQDLAAWIRVMLWTLEWETTQTSLSQSALGSVRDPATYYRTVERVTGLNWNLVRTLGSDWVLLGLVESCGRELVVKVEVSA
jgi:hypothetical protein